MRKLLLKRIDSKTEQLNNLRILQQFLSTSKSNMMFLRKLLHLTVFWHNQGRYKFPLVCNNGHLINITIYHQLGFNGLRSNVLTIGSFKQILDSVRQVQETIFHISGISRTEPTIFCKCLLSNGFFLIISLRYGTSTKLYLVIFSNTYLYPVKHTAYCSQTEISNPITRDSGRTFRQPITSYHINTYRMHELCHLLWNSSSCRRKEIPVLYSYRFLQQAINRFLIKLIFHVQQGRGRLSVHQIRNVMFTPNPKRIQHQTLFQTRSLIDFFLYAGIYLFPKTRHTAHSRRPYFLDCLLNVLRTQIDTQHTSFIQTIIRPCPFKDVRKRQEIHDDIIFTQIGQTCVMPFKSNVVVRVMQHYPF